MNKVAVGLVVGGFLLGSLISRPLAQAIVPGAPIQNIQCKVNYYVNLTPWETVEAGGNLNVLYVLKTTEQLPTGLYQTGIAVCYDNSSYNWNYTYR